MTSRYGIAMGLNRAALQMNKGAVGIYVGLVSGGGAAGYGVYKSAQAEEDDKLLSIAMGGMVGSLAGIFAGGAGSYAETGVGLLVHRFANRSLGTAIRDMAQQIDRPYPGALAVTREETLQIFRNAEETMAKSRKAGNYPDVAELEQARANVEILKLATKGDD